jgi:glyoxalase family protein
MNLHGLHHVTAVSGRISQNAQFYTQVLGLRLVKKSVNQDDLSAYHLFYADKVGTPGTDITFFDWPQTGPDQRGTDSIVTTAFRVNGRQALDYWSQRLREYDLEISDIEQFNGRAILRFADPEGQRLALVDDGGADFEGVVWEGSDVPADYTLRGFYAVMISVPERRYVEPILTQVLHFSEAQRVSYPTGQEVIIYNMDDGGPGRELWLIEEPDVPIARLGAGGVHHVAYRVRDQEEQAYWRERIAAVGLPISGFIDRYYFHASYFRISNGILFEIATDGPGFAMDEDPEKLGERLALPPFLEPQRAQIEAGLKPI